jgi:hypothetical protein
MPEADEVRRAMTRVAPALGGAFSEGRTAAAIEIVAMPYGAPDTPEGLVLARLVAWTLAAHGEDAAPSRWTAHWMDRAPSADVRAHIDDLLAASGELWPSALRVARSVTAVRRAEALGAEVASALGRTILVRAVHQCRQSSDSPAVAAYLLETAGEAGVVTEMRGGDYEACDLVMRALWDPPGQQSLISRVFADDPWSAGRAWLTRARIANHQGDCELTDASLAAFDAAIESEQSLRATILKLEGAILRGVAAQNRWPFEADDIDAWPQMARARDRLVALIDLPLREGPACDPLTGMALGTLARTHAFLGDHAKARDLLRLARRCFSTERDLQANAVYAAHVALEAAADFADTLADVHAAVPSLLRAPEEAVRQLQSGNLAVRFAINVWVKALNLPLPDLDAARLVWTAALRDGGEGSLFRVLALVPSHPVDLIARHAGELLAAASASKEARRWFDLGIAVGRRGGSTMRRLGRFTERLADGWGPDASAPRGSVFNPSFEYR